MIRYNLLTHQYQWDRWNVGNWTYLSDYMVVYLLIHGEHYVGMQYP